MLLVVVDFPDEDDVGPFDILHDFRQIGRLLVADSDELGSMGVKARGKQKYEYDYRTMKGLHGIPVPERHCHNGLRPHCMLLKKDAPE